VTRFSRLAVATCAATFVLIAIGGLVRATESGLGCPDWPGCSTDWDVHAWVEYSHRTAAAIVATLMVALAISAFVARRDRFTRIASVATVVLVLVQAGLGALVVLLELRAELVTVHLALALTLLALTVVVAERALRGRLPASAAPGPLRAMATLAAVAVMGQMLVGSWVTGSGAGVAFTDFPLMDGRLVPPLVFDVLRALNENMTRYEQAFGEIRRPGEHRRPG